MMPEASELIAQFEEFEAWGYKRFCSDNIHDHKVVIVENAQNPTEQLELLLAEYLACGREAIPLADGGAIFPDERVVIAMQQLDGDGVNREVTKQHILRIACQI